MPKFFAGLFLNTSIISLLICMCVSSDISFQCVQNLLSFFSTFRLGSFGTKLYLLI